jgi:hypothetical protein
MQYLLRDLRTGQFFANSGEWTASQDGAKQFASIDEAIAMAAGLESKDLEVFFGNGGIRLPVPEAVSPAEEMAASPRTAQTD